jgi:CheY-like chemotaxis protein
MPDRLAQSNIVSGHDWRLSRLPNLMARRVEKVLLVSSAYDAFILEEDGLLTELIFSEYIDLGLSNAPQVTRASSAEEALQLIRASHFDLVITMLRLGDMNVAAFGRAVRELRPGLPVVLLIANELELAPLGERRELSSIDSLYVWNGEPKIFLAIIKLLEDRWNVENDTETGGVGVVILVEDSVRYRSTLLPIMYSELVRQTRSVMAEGLNRMQRLLRLRARPKILVAETFEQGMELYQRYREYIFGVIADVSFLREGRPDPLAGIEFIRQIKRDNPDVPALLQSSDPGNRYLAEAVQTSFLHKRSPTLHEDVREFMLRNFGFGDFVFRMPDGHEVARAADLRSMARVLAEVPPESLEFHARRNHFSNWLRARGEFLLARRLRPRKVSEFSNLETLRRYLILAFEEAVRQNRRGVVADFSRERFDPGVSFARIGAGSLGGKARGLAFIDALLARNPLEHRFSGVRIYVPRCVVIGTSVFDEFLELNHLRPAALRALEDARITGAFLAAELPEDVRDDLRAFLETVRYPLAVRSSALLEDSPDYPFAGVYETHMLPNNDADGEARLEQLCQAVRLVYASAFYRRAQRYLGTTPHPMESQRMGVIVQQIVGSPHEHYFYPSFAGVVRSYNFYPFGQMRPEEGVACVALGLGKLVVEGGPSLRFCPLHPHVLPQLGLGREFLDASQREFYAIDLTGPVHVSESGQYGTIVRLGLEAAERHGTLAALGSVWSEENECFYDGIYREGVRAVTFAHVLKSDLFPLAEVLRSRSSLRST